MDYEVKLDVFEGPLDLLLHLIKKNELDIYDIPIALITRQYLEYLEALKALNLDLAGEYLVLAATLVHIKSKMLLPETTDEGEEEPDPRRELVEQLLEYQAFKKASQSLQTRELLDRDVFARGGAAVTEALPQATPQRVEVGLFELVDAFRQALGRLSPPERIEIDLDRTSLADRINAIMERLRRHRSLTFAELIEERPERRLIVHTFIALLELVRQRLIRIFQEGSFGTIRVFLAVEEEHE
ncbi:MAG: segregation/condensation protein A [Pseudomonadota bacterium]|nr:segregation/condensation protein A [Pseudomonadota bacterium]